MGKYEYSYDAVEQKSYFIIENIKGELVNLDHKVKEEKIDEVLLIPLKYMMGERVRVPKKNKPKQLRSLVVAKYVQEAIEKIKQDYLNIFPELLLKETEELEETQMIHGS